MNVELRLKAEIGCLGIEKSKGLFLKYFSGTYGNIELEFFKSVNNGKYYYLIDNMNISYFTSGKSHNDIMVIHSKIEKIILSILNLKTYTEKDFNSVKELKNKLFNYKKYEFDGFNLKELYITVGDNKELLKEYINR